eukprot:1181481-Prorocentrum_minimum.AAC.3
MDTEIQQFYSARTFTDNKGPINSLDFHRTEDLLVTGGEAHLSQLNFGSSPPNTSSVFFINTTNHDTSQVVHATIRACSSRWMLAFETNPVFDSKLIASGDFRMK